MGHSRFWNLPRSSGRQPIRSRVPVTPYLKVALCLSYITGPKVDAWVKLKREWLKSQVKHQRCSFNNEKIWEDFEEDFRTAFMDTDAKLTAFEKLHNLRMVGSNIDSYIAEFERLREETRYRKDDLGAIIKFKEGLQPQLLQQVITHNVPAPNTLDGWMKKARERQTVYKELKNAGMYKKTQASAPNRWAQLLGLKNYVPPAQRPTQATGHGHARHQSTVQGQSQVVPMDVDVGRGFTPLTDEERTDLRNKGACFRCRQTGHMSRVCPQRCGQNNLNQMTIRTVEVSAEPAKSLTNMIKEADPKDLITMLKGADEEKRTAIADGMQDF
jgi:hypothetical protein